MKKIILFTLAVGMIAGCTEHKRIEIDQCEYIESIQYGKGTVCLTHKGNCKNPIHKGGKQ